MPKHLKRANASTRANFRNCKMEHGTFTAREPEYLKGATALLMISGTCAIAQFDSVPRYAIGWWISSASDWKIDEPSRDTTPQDEAIRRLCPQTWKEIEEERAARPKP